MALAGCGTPSVADFEQQLWDNVREEIPTAAKPDCPADAKIEDGQSFTCTMQVTEVGVPAAPGGTPKTEFESVDVDVTIEGDSFRWETTK
jgi:hypothetical protein